MSQRKLTPKQIRRRRRRRKKILRTLLLVLLLFIIGGGVGFFIYRLQGQSFDPLNQSYTVTREFATTLEEKEELRSKSFASDLCVVEGNVELPTVAIPLTQSGLLMDVDRGTVLYSQNAYRQVYPASITKIMTAVLAFKYGNMAQTVTITDEDLNLEQGAQMCGFWAGDKLTMDQLVHCLLVYSGNDAASAIARTVGGSVSGFVDLMNNYARTLGCTGTHFTNPHGLQDEQHYTTPYDIYLMLKEALNYPRFSEITQLSEYTVRYKHSNGNDAENKLEATDHYLTGEATAPKNVTILGGKTGTTSLAGNCLALLSQNAYGRPFVSIVMGASTKDVLYQQMNSLLQNINNTP